MEQSPLDLKDIESHLLSSVPTSMFDRKCDINIAALTSSPKTGYRIQNQQDKLNTRHICDWWVHIWVIYWPTIGNLQTIYNGVRTYVLFLICTNNVFLGFDRHYQCSARTRQACQQARTHKLTLVTSLPKQSVVLANTHNKVQVLYEDIQQRTFSHPELNLKLRITSVTGLSLPVSYYLARLRLMLLNVL